MKKLARGAFVVCVDGGANIAANAGITPDIIIGDMDSVLSAVKKAFQSCRRLKSDYQDNSDFDKALNFVTAQKFKQITIVCATGNRLDFTLSNLYASFKYLKKTDIVFKSAKWDIYPINKTTKFAAKKGARVSLIPVTKCTGLSLSGLKYPLKNAALNPLETLTVSNAAIGKKIEVKIKKGNLLVYIEK